MTRITENIIESFAIELFDKLGYEYIYAPNIDKRDVASDYDIEEIDWKKDWPIYICVQNPEFIDSSMRNCPKMSELIDKLIYDSFDKTQRKYLNGEEEINVWAMTERPFGNTSGQ